MNNTFKNIYNKKVLVEKIIDWNKKSLYGLKFCSYQSNRESLLIVDFNPRIKSVITTDTEGNHIEDFDPINFKIIDSFDNNGSFEFFDWIDKFENSNKNTKGVDMFLFKLNFDSYQSIVSLRGCSLNSISVISGQLNILVSFFAYTFHRENC